VQKKEFPSIRFYDQDFVDIYNQTWAWVEDYYTEELDVQGTPARIFIAPESDTIYSLESIFHSSWCTAIKFTASLPQLDFFYARQEENGAIRDRYSAADGKPVRTKDIPRESACLCSPGLNTICTTNWVIKSGSRKSCRSSSPISTGSMPASRTIRACM
jgi:hypothetical protein